MPGDSIENILKINKHLCLDVSHISLDTNLLLITKKYFKNIRHIHFSDNLNKADEHLLPNTGILPLKKLLKFLSNNKYYGSIVIELIPENYIESKNNKEIINILNRTFSFVNNNI